MGTGSTLVLNGTIIAAGFAGNTSDAGGGGAGGSVWLNARDLHASRDALVDVRGGDGAASSTTSPAGGGGLVFISLDSVPPEAHEHGGVDVDGGRVLGLRIVSSGGRGGDGGCGGPGTVVVTDGLDDIVAVVHDGRDESTGLCGTGGSAPSLLPCFVGGAVWVPGNVSVTLGTGNCSAFGTLHVLDRGHAALSGAGPVEDVFVTDDGVVSITTSESHVTGTLHASGRGKVALDEVALAVIGVVNLTDDARMRVTSSRAVSTALTVTQGVTVRGSAVLMLSRALTTVTAPVVVATEDARVVCTDGALLHATSDTVDDWSSGPFHAERNPPGQVWVGGHARLDVSQGASLQSDATFSLAEVGAQANFSHASGVTAYAASVRGTWLLHGSDTSVRVISSLDLAGSGVMLLGAASAWVGSMNVGSAESLVRLMGSNDAGLGDGLTTATVWVNSSLAVVGTVECVNVCSLTVVSHTRVAQTGALLGAGLATVGSAPTASPSLDARFGLGAGFHGGVTVASIVGEESLYAHPVVDALAIGGRGATAGSFGGSVSICSELCPPSPHA